MALVRGIWFWLTISLVTLVCVTASAFGQLLLFWAPRARRQEWGHLAGMVWGQATYRLMPFWSVDIQGREHLPRSGQPMVIVSNHQSASDIWVAYFLDVQFRWLSKKEVFKIPLIGQAMHWAGYISLDRGNSGSHREAMDQAASVLKSGASMFFFPEGTRTKDGKMKEFKLGAFRLAHAMQVPVLPVVVYGAKDLMPKGSLVPGRAHVRIRILPPQSLREFEGAESDVGGFAAHIRSMMERAYHEMAESPAAQPKVSTFAQQRVT
jgi:1-acyl-sn-glycerol-3-phosphate acyltransferase